MDSQVNDAQLALPKQTTPTWEMELLISGASVFALLQLPDALNHFFLNLQIQIHDHFLNAILLPLFLYAKVAVVILAITFLLHLVSRAYWVGLIGLNSVFPGGPSIEHMQNGPLYSAHLRRTLNETPDQLIDRADNRATIIFGFGVGLTLMVLMPVIFIGGASLLVLLLRPLIASETAFWGVIWAFMTTIILFALVPSLLDKVFGSRIKPDSILGRAITANFALMKRIEMDGTGNVLILYLFAQAKSYAKAAIFFAAIGFLLSILSMTDAPSLLSVKSKLEVVKDMEVSDYVNERNGNLEFAMRASIPEARNTSGWLDLKVPVPTRQPSNDIPKCQDDSSKAITDCLIKFMRVSIDGKSLDIDWQKQRASNDQPEALRTMLDVSTIPSGKHTLTIDYLPYKKKPLEAKQELIVFWN